MANKIRSRPTKENEDRDLQEIRSEVVSDLSHELRTPLSAILSSAELLEHYGDTFDQEKKLEHLRRIQSAVQQMIRILNSLRLPSEH